MAIISAALSASFVALDWPLSANVNESHGNSSSIPKIIRPEENIDSDIDNLPKNNTNKITRELPINYPQASESQGGRNPTELQNGPTSSGRMAACRTLRRNEKPSGFYLHFQVKESNEAKNLCGNILDGYKNSLENDQFSIEPTMRGYNVLIGPVEIETKANQMCDDLKTMLGEKCFTLLRLARRDTDGEQAPLGPSEQ